MIPAAPSALPAVRPARRGVVRRCAHVAVCMVMGGWLIASSAAVGTAMENHSMAGQVAAAHRQWHPVQATLSDISPGGSGVTSYATVTWVYRGAVHSDDAAVWYVPFTPQQLATHRATVYVDVGGDLYYEGYGQNPYSQVNISPTAGSSLAAVGMVIGSFILAVLLALGAMVGDWFWAARRLVRPGLRGWRRRVARVLSLHPLAVLDGTVVMLAGGSLALWRPFLPPLMLSLLAVPAGWAALHGVGLRRRCWAQVPGLVIPFHREPEDSPATPQRFLASATALELERQYEQAARQLRWRQEQFVPVPRRALDSQLWRVYQADRWLAQSQVASEPEVQRQVELALHTSVQDLQRLVGSVRDATAQDTALARIPEPFTPQTQIYAQAMSIIAGLAEGGPAGESSVVQRHTEELQQHTEIARQLHPEGSVHV